MITFTATLSGAGNAITWEVATSGNNWTTIGTGSPYSGETTLSLTINPVTAALNGYRYRCVNTNSSCTPPDDVAISNEATLTVDDTEDPVIVCGPDITRTLDGSCNAPVLNVTGNTTTLSDNCDSNPTVTQSPLASATISATTTVTLTATDDSSNFSTCTFQIIAEDNTDPTISNCPGNDTVAVNGSCQSTIPDYTSQATATDNCTATITQSPAPGPNTGLTPVTITLTATDGGGNTDDCTFMFVPGDSSAPTITCPSNKTEFVDGSCDASLPDFSGDAGITDNCPSGVSVTQSPAASTISGAGVVTTITLTATDGGGNTDDCTFTFTQSDTTRPAVTCPPNDTVYLDSANCQVALPDYLSGASATDNCDSNPTLSQSPTSGSLITGAGTVTTVTITGTDTESNAGTCTFDVTALDTVKPDIVCPPGEQVFVDDTCATSVKNYIPLVITSGDNCDSGPSITQIPTAGTTISGTGFTPVFLVIEDASGNKDSCLVPVSRSDSTPPVLTCPPNQDLPANAFCQLPLPDFESAAVVADNCDSSPTVSQNPGQGTPFSGVGTTINVTLTANDVNINSSQCTFTVTIVDGTDPVVSCPADQTVYVDGSCTIPLDDYLSQTSVVDNCDLNVSLVQSPTAGTVLSATTPPDTVTMTATDASGNTANCSFTVTALDTIRPTLVCVSSDTVYLDANCDITLDDYIQQSTTTDNCGTPLVVQVPSPGTILSGVGTTTVTISSEDAASNSRLCSFVVTRLDTTRPNFNCQSNQDLIADASCQAAIPDYATAVTDNCTQPVPLTQTPAPGTILTGVGSSQVVTLSATDNSGNNRSCTFTATVVDQTPPSVGCPGNQSLFADANCQILVPDYLPQVSTADNCDGNPTLAQSPAGGTTASGAGTVVNITVTSTDASTNQDSCTFTLTVIDNILPTISCPPNQTLVADANCQNVLPNFVTQATIADNCDANPAVVQTPAPGTTISGANTNQIITLQVTDASTNTDDCTFQVTLLDQTAPNLTCPANQVLVADSTCQALLPAFTPTVSDNCDPNPVTVQTPPQGTVLSGAGSTQTITFTSTDANSNLANCTFSVTLEDQTVPDITCPGNQVIFVDAGCNVSLPNYVSQTISTDNCTPNVSITQSPLGQVLQAPNVVTVTMTATDGSFNTNDCSFTVTAQDTTRPSLTCPQNQTLQVNNNCSATFPDYRPSALTQDNCTAQPTVLQSPAPGDTTTTLGPQLMTISSADAYNNIDSCNFVVTVLDTIDPVITCPVPITLVLDGNCQATITDYTISPNTTVSDNCTANPVVTQVPTPLSTISGGGITTVTLTADDGNGNLDSCSINVTVFDLQAPVITCPPDTTMVVNANCDVILPDFTTGASVVDNCSQQVTVLQNPLAGTTVTGGGTTINVVLTAIDATGNQDNCTVIVTLVDNTPPMITGCPNNITNTPTALSCNPPVFWTPPVATDACGASVASTHQPGDNFPVGTTTVSYTATDSSGNSTTCNFDVTVNTPQLDSIITLSDTMPCQGDTIMLIAQPGLASYNWSTTDTTQMIDVSTPGTYWVDLTDSTQCAGRDSITVTFNSLPSPAITQVGGDLCTGSNFITFQWYRNDTLLVNDTTDCLTPTINGNYTVVVTDLNGCENESQAFVFVGMSSAMSAQAFDVFPNPTRGLLTLRMEQPLLEPGEVILWDQTGRKVLVVPFEQIEGPLRLDLSAITNGTYVVELRSEGFNGRRRIVRLE